VITAIEALKLKTAQLSADDLATVDRLESQIEEHIRMHMEHRGCELSLKETNNNIIAELNQRLKEAGYATQWGALTESHPLNAAKKVVVGFHLVLAPTDEAYGADRSRSLS
jgi:hypothetical protein